jgi:hypothetical protein
MIVDIEYALKVLQKNHPCGHVNSDTTLGNGRIWAKCEDCGEEFRQDYWPILKKNSEDYENAVALLSEKLKPNV